MKTCPNCGYVYRGKRCPVCGYVPKDIQKSEGVLYGPLSLLMDRYQVVRVFVVNIIREISTRNVSRMYGNDDSPRIETMNGCIRAYVQTARCGITASAMGCILEIMLGN